MKNPTKPLALLLCALLLASLAACAHSNGKAAKEDVAVQLFIAASLENAFREIIPLYQERRPDVTIACNADSSGKLLAQVREGFACDVFFSASPAQVNALAEEGRMIEGTRVDLLRNKLALITQKGSGTAVTGFANLEAAKSMALADGSVPAGRYARQALIALGVLDGNKDAEDYTTEEVSLALGGLEINECANVGKVKESVKEGANEVGAVYHSDAYAVRDDVAILELADSALTGDILYPVCRVHNPEATQAQTAAADDFFAFLQSDAVMAIFREHMFLDA